jgi:hypothetical protein
VHATDHLKTRARCFHEFQVIIRQDDECILREMTNPILHNAQKKKKKKKKKKRKEEEEEEEE